jgi:hypothetical protein
MATRKTIDDKTARDEAQSLIHSLLTTRGDDTPAGNARGVLEGFDTAEFETATTKVGGQPLELRRIVLTGPWEPVRK